MIERATSYIDDVLAGRIVCGKLIRLAIERHVNDLKRVGRPGFPYHFSEDEAARVLGLYEHFKFSKGKETGKPFDLMRWWAAIVYMAFGWRNNDGRKRFKKIYCKVARGNAKTANLVTIGTIGFLFDGASDPEIYWAATKKDQSKIGWDRQRSMLRMMASDIPEIGSMLRIPNGDTSSRVSRNDCLSWVTYLGKDSNTEDGLSPYYALIDEYHAWDNNGVMNVLESGMVKVDDPVTWIITTAGYNPEGPNSEFLSACKNMLEGVAPNDELLAFIYELDEGDDWKDERVWPKANPALGHDAYRETLLNGIRTEFNKIKTEGLTKEIDFKVKNMNIEQAAKRGWLSDDVWMKGGGMAPDDELKARQCWAGLDLGNTSDFNSFVLFWPPDERHKNSVVKAWYWIPESAIEQHRVKRPFVERWAAEGHITIMPGNVTDYDMIREDIVRICAGLPLQMCAFDQKFASAIIPKLIENGVPCEPLTQSWTNLTPAVAHTELAIKGETLLHGGNPVLRWNMRNVVMQYDRNGNALPSKGASAEKIDGVAAMLNAIGQWVKDTSDPTRNQGSYLFEENSELIVF